MTISIGQVGAATPTNVSPGIPLTTAAVTTNAGGSGFVVMVASVTGTTGAPTYTVADSFSNNYARAAELLYTSGGAAYRFNRWYIAPGAAGYAGGGAGHTATLNVVDPIGGSFVWMTLMEMPGAASSNAAFYGAPASATYPFSTVPPYASASLVVAPPSGGAILLSGMLNEQPTSGTGTESTGFTVELTSILGVAGGAIGLKAVTASNTYTPSWSWSPTTGAVEAFSSVDSFFGAAGPPPPGQNLYTRRNVLYFI